MRSGNTEWVRLSTDRRIAYGLVALCCFLLLAAIAWLDIQARAFGMIDGAIMGGALAGGGFLAYSAILGKEQRKIAGR
jgi:hypothetical protein